MNLDYKRRSRLMGLSARQHSWEQEHLRQRSRKASAELQEASMATEQACARIEQTESLLFRSMEGNSGLDLVAIQAARNYLAEQISHHKQCVSQEQRTAQRAEQLERQLKECALTIKGLESIKAQSDHQTNTLLEKRLQELNTELWLQYTLLADK